jgi:NAD(P)H-dependent FMN reductase
MEQAQRHGRFDVELLDLKVIDLPLLSEPNHPRSGKYMQDKTKAWSATIAELDAFVAVTPEYNYNSPQRSSMRSTICSTNGTTRQQGW